MQLSSIVRMSERALDAVSDSFSPSRSATSAQIRKNGLVCLGIGLGCFVVGGLVIATIPQTPGPAMLPLLLAYAFMIVGAYRAVLGKTPEPAHPGELSIKRIAFGITTIIFVFAAIIGLAYLGTMIYERWR